MADSDYPYPPDEFDREAATASLYGAHRAELPFWRQNLVYLVIIAAAFVMLLVLLFAIGGGDESTEGRGDAPTTGATETTAEESGAAEETTEEPAPEPDLGTPVMVMNAGGINGMAGDWQEALEGEGWTAVDVGTADGQQEEAVVFYRDEDDAATAQALAEQVGAGEATQSDEYDATITFLAVTPPEGGEGE